MTDEGDLAQDRPAQARPAAAGEAAEQPDWVRLMLRVKDGDSAAFAACSGITRRG